LTSPKINKKNVKQDLSLIDIINKTMTKMGHRALYHLFFTPIYDIDILNSRYDKISHYIENKQSISNIRSSLQNICDFEKKSRQIGLSKLNIHDFCVFIKNIKSIQHLLHLNEINHQLLNEFFEKYNIFFTIENEELIYYDSFFENMDIKKIDEQILVYEQKLNDFLSKYDCQKKKSNTNEIIIYTTTKKWKSLKEKPKDVKAKDMANGSCRLSGNDLDFLCFQIQKLQEDKMKVYKNIWMIELDSIYEKYKTLFDEIISQIIDIDIYSTFAFISIQNKYIRPTFFNKEDKNKNSMLICKNIRHPIIEQIQENEEFTTNDIYLDNEKHGLIVYGLNSAGKSTLLRSIGLNVIMAQIGMFVPCSEFQFIPFHNLFTKIFIMDNLYKGQSTFLYELHELHYILNKSNEYSLILCDELTSGTETLSATGIMASTILSCITNQSRFVMTTHLHTLSHFPEIIKNKHLQIKHFAVYIDSLKNIQYDRKLHDGMGNSLYGIEIAEAIGFQPIFIKQAFDFRNKISNNLTKLCANKRSRYNKKLIVDKCSICGSIENLHTHHIIPQKEFDEHGFKEHIQKNKLYNLQVLCEKCHIHLHHT
jgi:DNA mismatch repair protein MutS